VNTNSFDAGLSFLSVNLSVPWTYSYQINQCSRGIVLNYELQRNSFWTQTITQIPTKNLIITFWPI